MGAIWFRGREFVSALSETLGYKTGLALSEERLRTLVEDVDADLWPPSDDVVMRIRSEAFEEVFVRLLSRLGAGPGRLVISPLLDVYRRNRDDPQRARVAEQLMPRFTAFLEEAVAASEPGAKIDPSQFVSEASQYGQIGIEIGMDYLETLNAYLYQSPFNRLRRVEWEEIRDLDELFRSERLESGHGQYFDQRFVDFLAANFDDIDVINWRQFEGLAAEYFGRAGFRVALGPGRGDEGVDIRLWHEPERAEGLPATVLVQCKRERRKVTKAIVKALWADMVHEQADSGLIVTTSSFSRGARETRNARSYPILEADRETLRKWLIAMRTPGAGIFLGG